MIRAVLFDMDGLLVDSERVAMACAIESGHALGYPITMELALQTLGVTRAFTDSLYASHFPGFDPARYHALFDQNLASRAKAGEIPAKAGATALLDYLDEKGIARAVASSSGQERVKLCLSKAGLLDYFPLLVTGDQVTHSKPDPEIFLLAAKKLGVAPEECLVLEDSLNGIKAGRAGGMRVGMVPDLLPYSEACAPYCDDVFADLSQVIPLLERLNQKP